MQHKLERLWIMSLLKESLRSDCDYPVYRKRNVISILMTHYSSLLTDSSMKVYCWLWQCSLYCFVQLQILLLIKQASLLNVVATDLVWNKGLLAWLHFVADSTTSVISISYYGIPYSTEFSVYTHFMLSIIRVFILYSKLI